MMIALNLLGPCPFGYNPNAYDLLMFASGSIAVISLLMLYYNKIPKTNRSKSVLDNPIYQTKDILLHSNSRDNNFIITQKTTSAWVKILVFVLITLVVIIPLDQLFSLVNRFY